MASYVLADKDILDDVFRNIANAIREKGDNNEEISVDNMANTILNLKTGSPTMIAVETEDITLMGGTFDLWFNDHIVETLTIKNKGIFLFRNVSQSGQYLIKKGDKLIKSVEISQEDINESNVIYVKLGEKRAFQVIISTVDISLFGTEIRLLKNDNIIDTQIINNGNSMSVSIYESGNYTISTKDENIEFNVTENDIIENKVLSKIVGVLRSVAIVITTEDVLLDNINVSLSSNDTLIGTQVISLTNNATFTNIIEPGEYTITFNDESKTIQISKEELIVGNPISVSIGKLREATILINTIDDALYGETISLYSGDSLIDSKVMPSNGNISFKVSIAGLYTVKYGNKTTNVTITTDNIKQESISTVNVNLLKIVTWTNGTDEEIANMVRYADAGKINLKDYWSVGDSRAVQLSAMSAAGVSESHSSQQISLVLMDSSGMFTLSDATSGGKTKCDFVVGMKNCLNERGYMNSSDTNSGSWRDSKRRVWCNSVFRDAFPSGIRGIFKQFKVITGDYNNQNSSGNITTQDYFALPAEKEIFGSKTYSVTAEAEVLTQMEWYKNSSNRIKYLNGSAYWWWERSPYYSSSYSFCLVYSDGSAGADDAYYNGGLAPFGCI